MINNSEYLRPVLVDHSGRDSDSQRISDHGFSPDLDPPDPCMTGTAGPDQTNAFYTSLNSLLTAASELLSEVVRLKHSSICENLNTLNARLAEGLKRFEVDALRRAAPSSQVMAARYVLCSVLDETVGTTPWGSQSEWSQMSLLSSFHNETFGGEKFFHLLERMSKNPVKNLYMLELMYVCLSLGFEGKYRVQPRGVIELEGVRDALYRQIRHVRGHAPRDLSPRWQGLIDVHRAPVRVVPLWRVVTLTVTCLVIMYSGFAWVLSEQRSIALQPYQLMDSAAARPQQQP